MKTQSKTHFTSSDLLVRQHGGIMMEFAVVLPILMLILFGIAQMGFLFGTHLQLRNAAAVVSRLAVVKGGLTASEAHTSAMQTLAGNYDGSRLTAAAPTTTDPGDGGPLMYHSSLQYSYPLLFSYAIPSTGGAIQLNAEATYR